jgi:hypothetical protein
MKSKKSDPSEMTCANRGIERVRAEALKLEDYLVKRLQHVVSTVPETPEITFNVTDFHAIGEPGGSKTVFGMTLTNDGGGRVSLSPPKNPTTIVVNFGDALNIRFTVNGIGAANQCVPIAASFRLDPKNTGAKPDPDENFPQGNQIPSGVSLDFTDRGMGDGTLFEFKMIIRRSSDRSLGVIDPGIQHINGNIASIAQ